MILQYSRKKKEYLKVFFFWLTIQLTLVIHTILKTFKET